MGEGRSASHGCASPHRDCCERRESVLSAQCRAEVRSLADPEDTAQCLILSVVMEPLRRVCSWFLKSVGEDSRFAAGAAPLLDLVWDKSSIVAHALQYYSSILHGGQAAERLRL